MLSNFVLLIVCVAVVNLAKGEEMCKSEACLERAKEILDSIDETVDPCDNFYKFACGKFLKTQNRQGRYREVSTFSTLEKNLHKNIREIVEDPELTTRYPFEFVNSIKWYYDSCMDLDGVERAGSDPIMNLLESIDGLSLLNETEWTGNFSIERRVGLFAKAGLTTDFLMEVEITPNLNNTSQNIINLSFSTGTEIEDMIRTTISVDRNNLDLANFTSLTTKDLPLKDVFYYYTNLISKTISYLNGSITPDQIENIILLETQFANLTSQLSETKNNMSVMVNLMTIDELQERYNYLNWTQYISERMLDMIPLDGDTVVNVMDLNYFEKLEEILTTFEDKTISDYQSWKCIKMFLEFGPTALRDNAFLFKMFSEGITISMERSRFCMKSLINDFGVGISTLYVKKYFPDNKKRQISNALFAKIRDELELMLKSSDWLDHETRSLSIAKLKKLQYQTGYSDFLLNPEDVQTVYENLTLTKTSFLETVLELRKFNNKPDVGSLLNPPTTKPTLADLLEVTLINGFYIPYSNAIEIPAGILQDKLISVESPDALNYARIGFIFSHELIHAFDNNGRQFDDDGNVASWGTTSSDQLYSNKIQCIIDQFNRFTEPKTQLKINGLLTISENVADLEGLKLAYKSYKKFGESQGALFPNLNYTSDQLFWIAHSTTWCSVYRDTYVKHMVTYDVHAPAQFRINGALQNIPEFATDFGCPADSQMNPSKKCRVW